MASFLSDRQKKENHVQPLRILQVSDSHLFRDPHSQLLGIVTHQSLTAVLQLALMNGCEPDLILATGDIAQDGSIEAYKSFQSCLALFDVPVCWLSGNHDHLGNMRSVLSYEHINPCSIDLGAWRVIALDSRVAGVTSGRLSPEQLEFLKSHLSDVTCPPHVMVCLHHHPVPLNTRWLDEIGLKNSQEFFDVIDSVDHVRVVLWGHVHQAFEGDRHGVGLFASPSTCVQFKPGMRDFAADTLSPGYRFFELYPDGRVYSDVFRLPDAAFPPDLSMPGY